MNKEVKEVREVREIEQCVIPDILLTDDNSAYIKSRKWFPTRRKTKLQETDTYYKELKTFLMAFYSDGKETWLSWNPEYSISIEFLGFNSGGCGQCGIMYEVPEINGQIKYEGEIYAYTGHIKVWERYCECDSRAAEDKLNPDFLFDLYFSDKRPPTAQFIQEYTELKDMRKVS